VVICNTKKEKIQRSMKNKVLKVLGVVLSLALLSSLAMIATPVSAAPGQNDFAEVLTPGVMPNTGVGIMAIAPDGTIYAAVVEASPYGWTIYKSVDDGYSWTATSLDSGILDSTYWDEPTDIVISPNYAEDETFYVSTYGADIYRVTEAGDAYPILLKAAVDSYGDTANRIYDMDLWYDGSEIWIMAGTDIDVLVMQDNTFAPWLDQELRPYDASTNAFEVAFAPDFDSSGLIWAIVEDHSGGYNDDGFLVTSTYSPGQWGWVYDDCPVIDQDDGYINDSRYVDIAFPSFYSSASPVFYVGASDTTGTSNDGNICLIEIATVASGLDSECTPLLPDDDDIVSIEVSGEVILAGTLNNNSGSGVLYRSVNLGDTFQVADKLPTGEETYNVYMEASVAWGEEVFDPDEGVAFCTSRGSGYDESAVSISEDGGQTWNQISWIDCYWDDIEDMDFSPYTASQPAFIISDDDIMWYDSLWRTDDITAASPRWVRVWNGSIIEDDVHFEKVEYSQDGSNVMLYVENMDEGEYQIWKSTNNGQTFNHWRSLPDNAEIISDWEVYDGSTIFCANWNSGGGSSDYGFYGTSRFGPATKALYEVALESIALQPGFDPEDADNSVIVVGGENGDIYISVDAGANWSAAQPALASTEDVYVAFDADFADNGLIYFATEDGYVGQAAIANGAFAAAPAPVPDDKYDVEIDDGLEEFSGIWVSPDNTLYVIGGNDDDSTIYAYNTDGTIDIVGQNADAVGDLQMIADTVGSVYNWTVTTGDIQGALGTFIDGEVLIVIGDNLTADGVNVTGDIMLMGATSGATGYITVSIPAGALPAGETITVTSSSLLCDLPHTFTISFTNYTLPSGFTDGEALIVTGSMLEGDTGGDVDGTIAVEGATSGATATLIISGIAPGTFDDGEVVVVTSSALDVDETTSTTPIPSDTYCFRLLLHEDDNVWENRDITGAWGIWGTTGSNFVWTILDDLDIYAMEDTLSGPVTGVAVSSVGENTAVVSWNAMTGATEYEIRYDSMDAYSSTTSKALSGLADNTDFAVNVRVFEDEAFQSRWSTVVDFTTLQAIATPENQVPVNGMQDAPLLPSFVWSSVSNAVSYEFELSTTPDFASTVVSTTIAAPTTAYTCTTELAYDTNHYWRVRAVSDTGTKSDWCFSNFHTRTEEMPPVTIPPQVTPQVTVTMEAPESPDVYVTVVPPDITYEVPEVITVTQNPPATYVLPEREEPGTPVYIWVIVGIGAVLTIAVIVLIIRTRRVV
jgi:hypothetical protein